jgi:hypothetical protein
MAPTGTAGCYRHTAATNSNFRYNPQIRNELDVALCPNGSGTVHSCHGNPGADLRDCLEVRIGVQQY